MKKLESHSSVNTFDSVTHCCFWKPTWAEDWEKMLVHCGITAPLSLVQRSTGLIVLGEQGDPMSSVLKVTRPAQAALPKLQSSGSVSYIKPPKDQAWPETKTGSLTDHFIRPEFLILLQGSLVLDNFWANDYTLPYITLLRSWCGRAWFVLPDLF